MMRIRCAVAGYLVLRSCWADAPKEGTRHIDDHREPSRSTSTGRMSREEAVTATEAVGKDPEMVELEHRHSRFVWPHPPSS